MLTRSEILSFLTENKPIFQKEFHLLKLGLFGSYAQENATEYSDIDILIELQSGTPNIYELKKELKNIIKDKFGTEIDICREKAIRPAFKELILNDVIFVQER